MKNFCNVLKIIVLIILIPVLILFATYVSKSYIDKDNVPSMFEHMPLIVVSESMEKEIYAGDLILVEKAEISNLKAGDVIAFYSDTKKETIIVHRIEKIINNKGKIQFVTKGDNNNKIDETAVDESLVVGKYNNTKFKGIGKILMFIQTPIGIFISIGLPIEIAILVRFFSNRKNTKKEKSKVSKVLTKITLAVTILVVVALVLVSDALAKYIKEYSGEGTGIIAKWNVRISDLNGNDIDPSTTFDLFSASAVYDLDVVADPNDLSQEAGVLEADVKKGTKTVGENTGTIIAPGTWGKSGILISIMNDTEVSVDYGVEFESLINSIPQLQFSTDGVTWSNTVEDMYRSWRVGDNSIINEEYVLYWKWPYESSDDEAETELGIEGTATCLVKANFSITQAR